jgi:hypothetical protein
MTRSSKKRGLVHFVRHEKWALVTSVLLVALVQYLEYHGWLASPEGIVLDLFLRHAPAHHVDRPPPIVTLEVDDSAYDNCFCATSPMNPAVLKEIISRAAQDSPAVIGVDVITDAPIDYSGIRAELVKAGSEFRGNTIVWAVAVDGARRDPTWFWSWLWGDRDPLVVQPSRLLGQDATDPEAHGIHWAIPVFPLEEDLHLRRFPRKLSVLVGNHSTPVSEPSLASRIVEEYCRPGQGHHCDVRARDDDVLFSADQSGITHLQVACDQAGSCPREGPVSIHFKAMSQASALPTGAIVLIGGTFHQAKDYYNTPVGRNVPGLWINAYAIRAELAGWDLTETSPSLAIALDLVIGVVIVFVFSRRWSSLRPMIAASFLMVPAALALSAIAFWLGYIWLSCIGVAVGLMPHVILEIWRMNPKISHSAHAGR